MKNKKIKGKPILEVLQEIENLYPHVELSWRRTGPPWTAKKWMREVNLDLRHPDRNIDEFDREKNAWFQGKTWSWKVTPSDKLEILEAKRGLILHGHISPRDWSPRNP